MVKQTKERQQALSKVTQNDFPGRTRASRPDQSHSHACYLNPCALRSPMSHRPHKISLHQLWWTNSFPQSQCPRRAPHRKGSEHMRKLPSRLFGTGLGQGGDLKKEKEKCFFCGCCFHLGFGEILWLRKIMWRPWAHWHTKQRPTGKGRGNRAAGEELVRKQVGGPPPGKLSLALFLWPRDLHLEKPFWILVKLFWQMSACHGYCNANGFPSLAGQALLKS